MHSFQRIIGAWSLLNGFSSLNCKIQLSHRILPFWAGTQAHITLHALLMSPILTLWHRSFRNTGLTPRWCAPGALFSYPSQLKD
ncbi:protein YnhH [Pseudescherichia vulneris]|uniref:protein YnhH n=1 Tax=Pseudescherichia vulneris TaxID=566 RepID=UPI00406BBB18